MATSNFDFLLTDMDTQELYGLAQSVENSYVDGQYQVEFSTIRTIIENVAKMIIDFNFVELGEDSSFNDHLREIKNRNLADQQIIDLFHDLKKYGNESAHTIMKYDQETARNGLKKMQYILLWFVNSYGDAGQKFDVDFIEPIKEVLYQTNEKKLIYVQTGDNSNGMWPAYEGAQKIGDAKMDDYEIDSRPNSTDLREIAEKHRIQSYMYTAGVPHILEWAELAYRKDNQSWFRDYEVHNVLNRSNIKHAEHLTGQEWYATDLETVKKAIKAVKEGRSSIDQPVDENKTQPEIKLRPEQDEAVTKTQKAFKKSDQMLWNAKMRFGKTLATLQLIKNEKFHKVIIMTHRPVVSDSWFEDFYKMKMNEEGYTFGSKEQGSTLAEMNASDKPFIYFASIQDLRGSEVFGGKVKDKNELVAEIDWDLVVVDEAHEGTQTDLAQNVLTKITKATTKQLDLSGTPFNLMDQFSEEEVFSWDYVDEQTAKAKWNAEHPNEVNPYEGLPKVSMYTFEMKNKNKYADENKSFNFREFFRVDDDGKLVHETEVNEFLNNITTQNNKTNYPFSTEQFRNELRHTLWLLPGVKEATALKALMDKHPIFGEEYNIINIVDNGDSEVATESDLERVRKAITANPSETKTITLTVRKLTTGVNIKEWTAVMFLSNTNSAMQYLQAAFRAQTPFSDEKLGMKTNSYIFDFAPDRALTVMAESTKLNTGAGKLHTKKQSDEMNRLLNFLPILGETENGMKTFGIDKLLTQLKHVYAEKAVRSGFEDDSIYNDNLLTLTEDDAKAFADLKAIIGKTDKTGLPSKVEINNNGLDVEEVDKAEKAKKKPARQRTAEEIAAIEKVNAKKKERRTMISILRGISVRIPMLIFGMQLDIDTEVDIQTFVSRIDIDSWNEFMPKGITKQLFLDFSKYYDPEIFIEAGNLIRRRAKSYDALEYTERTEKIAQLFGTFKNPDKETVLTPWRVVNLHLSSTIGGLSYYDDEFKDMFVDGNPAMHWVEQDDTAVVYKDDTKILEINSKTGLYPLFVATSLFYKRRKEALDKHDHKDIKHLEEQIWTEILKNNIYVIAKTKMAKTITERTLSGYAKNEMNIEFIDNLTATLKDSVEKGTKLVQEAFGIMKFDAVVGNPPYQENDNGSRENGAANASASPLYHKFEELSENISIVQSLIMPARWTTGAGKGLGDFSDKMINDNHIKKFTMYTRSQAVFPNTRIGKIAYYLRNEKYVGETQISVHAQDSDSKYKGELNTLNTGVFIPFKELVGALSKVMEKTDLKTENMQKIVSVLKPYGLRTDFFKNPSKYKLPGIFAERHNIDDIEIFGLENTKRTVKYLTHDYPIPRGLDMIDKYKVFAPYAFGDSQDRFIGDEGQVKVIGPAFVGEKGQIVTETFLQIGNFETEYEANALLKYYKTKFFRAFMAMVKTTQHSTTAFWLIPLQNFTEKSDIDWTESISEVDQQLYVKYGLDEIEISFIEEKVKEMD